MECSLCACHLYVHCHLGSTNWFSSDLLQLIDPTMHLSDTKYGDSYRVSVVRNWRVKFKLFLTQGILILSSDKRMKTIFLQETER